MENFKIFTSGLLLLFLCFAAPGCVETETQTPTDAETETCKTYYFSPSVEDFAKRKKGMLVSPAVTPKNGEPKSFNLVLTESANKDSIFSIIAEKGVKDFKVVGHFCGATIEDAKFKPVKLWTDKDKADSTATQ